MPEYAVPTPRRRRGRPKRGESDAQERIIAAAVDEFYRLYLIPGVAHCEVNVYEPDAPWPQTTLQTVIDWVENGTAPDTLEGSGAIPTICRWPYRPLWTKNGEKFECVYDKKSVEAFTYDLDAYKLPVY